MTQAPLRVLISGAGIAGSCLAYWLSRIRHNTTITVIERSPIPRTTGQSVDIRGPAIEIIKRMNLEAAVSMRTTTEEGTQFVNSRGKSFAFFPGYAFTAEYEILRADLANLFLETTEGLGNVKYIYGESIKSLSQIEKSVEVAFTSGSSSTFDLVVAADGSASTTRSMILDEHVLKDSYNFLGQYIAFFSIPSLPTDLKLWQWYNTPKGLCIMLRPHRTGKTMGAYMCVTMPKRGVRDSAFEEALGKGAEAQKDVLRQTFENTGWQAKRILAGMDESKDFYMSRAAQVKLPKWTNGRAVVIGDAATATFGIGTSLAIESAFLLAGEISKIGSHDDVPPALEAYEAVFRELHKKAGDMPSWFPQAAFPQTSWGLWLRDTLLWLVTKTRAYKIIPNDDEVEWTLPEYEWVGAKNEIF